MACDHAAAVPVESIVTGEVLAALCPACDTQLPAEILGYPHQLIPPPLTPEEQERVLQSLRGLDQAD